ncbi:Uncharacterised protein [Paenibacillus macerans]|uniref:Uncharacterized protein n=1 Tax=Paenibacillus macerans TaxID=44252 RepID=A0A090ZQ01_PAEMA|nr:hypothetical protein DJ90_2041 [Paenibacillus macerans]SUA84426.1 Uncharacterised protein [Paenibacillus macerans]
MKNNDYLPLFKILYISKMFLILKYHFHLSVNI